MGGHGRPRVLRIPIWLPLAPVLGLLVASMALWGLWHSPWSPGRLQARLEALRQDNLGLQSQRTRAEEGLSRARIALEGIEQERSKLSELAAQLPSSDSNGLRKTDGFLGSLFGGRSSHPVSDVGGLLSRARRARERWDVLISSLEKQPALAAKLPTIRPVHAEFPEVESFARARDPFTGLMIGAQGVAWGVPVGTPVWSTGAGEVVDVTNLVRWGLTVEVDHGSGIRTLYCHLSQATVKIGDMVLRGQVVGVSGETGTTLGPRVFYAVFQGNKALSPWDFILPEIPTDTADAPDKLTGKI